MSTSPPPLSASLSSATEQIFDEKLSVGLGQRLGVPFMRAQLESVDVIIGSHHVSVEQSSIGVLGISLVVWDCGLYLVDYLSTLRRRLGKERDDVLGTCLDLGCGTGVVGIASLLLGASKCMFTDKVVSTSLRSNIESLSSEVSCLAEFVEFDWSCVDAIPESLTAQCWDTLLASDVLYESSLHDCILMLLRRLKFKKFILAYKRRHDDMERRFFSRLEADFAVHVVPKEDIDSVNLPILGVTGLYILHISPCSGVLPL